MNRMRADRRAPAALFLTAFAAFLAALAYFRVWAAVASLALVAFLVWFAQLAISIPAAPEAWKLEDKYLNRGYGLWVNSGLSSRWRNQLPRWLLLLAFLVLCLSQVNSVRESVSPRLLVAASCVLAIVSFVIAFSEGKSS